MKWSDTDLTDLRGYLDLLILAGLYRSSKPELLPALLATRERAHFSSLFVFTDTCSCVLLPKEEKSCHPDEHIPPRGCCDSQGGPKAPDNSGLQLQQRGRRQPRQGRLFQFFMQYLLSSMQRAMNCILVYKNKFLNDLLFISFVAVWMAIDINWNRGKNQKRSHSYH